MYPSQTIWYPMDMRIHSNANIPIVYVCVFICNGSNSCIQLQYVHTYTQYSILKKDWLLSSITYSFHAVCIQRIPILGPTPGREVSYIKGDINVDISLSTDYRYRDIDLLWREIISIMIILLIIIIIIMANLFQSLWNIRAVLGTKNAGSLFDIFGFVWAPLYVGYHLLEIALVCIAYMFYG